MKVGTCKAYYSSGKHSANLEMRMHRYLQSSL